MRCTVIQSLSVQIDNDQSIEEMYRNAAEAGALRMDTSESFTEKYWYMGADGVQQLELCVVHFDDGGELITEEGVRNALREMSLTPARASHLFALLTSNPNQASDVVMFALGLDEDNNGVLVYNGKFGAVAIFPSNGKSYGDDHTFLAYREVA
ncbi:hypothetical protein HON52_01235 [Candidatus Uhrbacteria bacterium]|jgi:hypothetical protein|nr:hypothetical protein [Candidatus Uhrbacteria bacterium]